MILTTFHLRRLAAAAAAVALFPAAAAAQSDSTTTIRVVVRGVEDSVPLRGAHVELLGAHVAANTDSMGVARLAGVRPGPTIVSIRKLGYGDERFPLTVPPRDTLTVEVDLQTEAVRLAEIRATARASPALRGTGFYDRQRLGVGSYAMRSEWEGRGRLEIGDVVRRMRGVRVVRTGDGRTLFVPSRASASIGSACAGVMIYVDGTPLMVDGQYDDVNQLISLSEVEAVETYAGPAEIPSQYNGTGSACAVVLVWRRGVR